MFRRLLCCSDGTARERKNNHAGIGKLPGFSYPSSSEKAEKVYVDDRVVGHPGGFLGGLRLRPYVGGHGVRPQHQRVGADRVARVLGVGRLLEQPLHVLALVQLVHLDRGYDRVRAGRRLGAARRVA